MYAENSVSRRKKKKTCRNNRKLSLICLTAFSYLGKKQMIIILDEKCLKIDSVWPFQQPWKSVICRGFYSTLLPLFTLRLWFLLTFIQLCLTIILPVLFYDLSNYIKNPRSCSLVCQVYTFFFSYLDFRFYYNVVPPFCLRNYLTTSVQHLPKPPNAVVTNV